MLLHQVYGPAEVSLEQVIEAFGGFEDTGLMFPTLSHA